MPCTYLLKPDLRVSVGMADSDHHTFSDMTVLDSVLLMSFEQVEPVSCIILTKGTLRDIKLPVRQSRERHSMREWHIPVISNSQEYLKSPPEVWRPCWFCPQACHSLFSSTVWRWYLAGRMLYINLLVKLIKEQGFKSWKLYENQVLL